jgi:23S rRNA (guanosine2251-2'-O)-methyltransferase
MGATAWKVSAGAAARVPVAHATNLVRDLVKCQNAGCFVVGLDMGGEADIQDVDLLTEPCVIVTGSEGKGLSRLVRDTCDKVAAIPMLAGTESLTASVATGIALYAAYRVRHQE